MRQKPGTPKPSAEKVVRDIRRRTRKQHSSEEKIRIVLEGLRGEDSIAELCRREGIASSLYYSWSKEFLEAGKRRLAGDTARQATSPEVKDLRLDEIASKFRQYVGLSVLTSLITGVASGLWAFAIGLDLALIWGLLNFFLNFVPVIGNIIGILPPTLYAAFQFQDWTMPLVTFAGYAVIQITISNFVYPMLQGRGMALPSVSIIVALSFWGWVWGLAGALLAVPLTIAFIIACQHFRGMQWIPELLLRDKPDERRATEEEV